MAPGPRRAKQIALKNASEYNTPYVWQVLPAIVWKDAAGRGASRKRPASPTGDVVKKKRKQTS